MIAMEKPAADVHHDPVGSRRLLRDARVRAGLSVAGLADALGVAATTVERWERLGTVPQRRLRENLARTLSVDIVKFEEVWGLRPRLSRSQADIIQIHAATEPRESRLDDLSEEERRFREAALTGLRKGYASSRWWVAAAVATARSLDIDWELPDFSH